MSKHPSRDSKHSTVGQKKAVQGRFLALEPRVLLDAAAVATAIELADHAQAGTASPDVAAKDSVLIEHLTSLYQPADNSTGRNVLFVDSTLQDVGGLLASLNLGGEVEIHYLDPTQDGLSQIRDALADGQAATSVYIISHGEDASVRIGASTLDATNISQFQSSLQDIGGLLTADADILLYGCNVARDADGKAFIDQLSALTGADVAASTDLTGTTDLGANWTLEYHNGDVTHALALATDASEWKGVLTDQWVQDGEITAGGSGVAITKTSDGKEWKFIGTAASNKVDVYLRDTSTGLWSLNTTITKADGFGTDVAAAYDRMVASAPTRNNGDNDGAVWVFSYSSGTGSWGAGTEIVNPDVVQESNTGDNDRFGISVDIAYDGAGNYRMVIGNPFQDFDNWGGFLGATHYVRNDAGVAFVYSSTAGAAFAKISEISAQATDSQTDNYHFGSVVAVTYDADSSKWWVAAGGDGGDGLYTLRYNATASSVNFYGTNLTGSGKTSDGAAIKYFAFSGTGNNAVAMDDDFMVIAGSASVQAYKLAADSSAWSAIGTTFGAGNAVVSIDDFDQSAAGDSAFGARLVYSGSESGTLYTYVADMNASGQFVASGLINTGVQEVAVALDHTRALDVVMTAASGVAQSWHYNRDPVANADSATTNEDTSLVINVASNDSDPDITAAYPFGDTLAIAAIEGSAASSVLSSLGATLTRSGGSLTYNPATSSYLQTLKSGQSVQETINLTIQDGQGSTKSSTVVVTVTGVNDVPVVTSVTPVSPLRTQQSGTQASYDLSAFFNDLDQGEDALLEPDVALGNITLPSGWTASKNGSLLLITIPAGAVDGSTGTVTVRVQDPNGAFSAYRSFDIKVDAVNNAPVVQNPALDQVALSQYGFSYQIPENTFYDSDPSPYDTLTYTATLSTGAALPSWLTFDASTRTFSGTPAAGDTGTITVRVTVNDGSVTASDDFAITVVNPSLHTTGQFTDGASANADFGFSTAISNNGLWMVVGSPGLNSSRGAVYVYEWTGSSWTQRAGTIQASDGLTNDKFGYSVAISDDGSRIVVGARGDDGGMGSAYCYTRTGTGATTAYGSEGKLQASTRLAEDFFGGSVAINESGTYVLIGASNYNANGLVDSGAAFMTAFTSSGTTNLSALITPKDAAAYDRFGASVAFDQDILVVSAMADDNPSGMVSRIAFDESDGATANASFGSTTATLGSGAQFYYDATRGEVLQLTGTGGMANLNSVIDLGNSWTISAWYKDIYNSGTWRTLTRGSQGVVSGGNDGNHQIIVDASNVLGAYNNSGTAGTAAGFNAAIVDTYDQQLLTVNDSAGNFTLTVGGVTTASIAYSKVGTVMAARIQDALNATALGNVARVQVVSDGTNDVLRVTFINGGTSRGLLSASVGGVSATRAGAAANASYSYSVATTTFEEQILLVTANTSFTLSVDDANDVTQTTASITSVASAATTAGLIQDALNTKLGGSTTSGMVTVSVLGADGTTGDSFKVTFNDGTAHNLITASSTSVTAAREQQVLLATGGSTGTTFTMTVPGLTGATGPITYAIGAAAQATSMQTALNALLASNGFSTASAVVSVVNDGTNGADTFVVVFKNFTPTNPISMTGRTLTSATRTVAQSAALGTYSYTNSNIVVTLSPAQLSGWHNIVAVGDGANVGTDASTSYYIDGVKVGTAYFKATDDIAVVGNYQGGGQRFSDNIDDFRVYDRALSASEIRNIAAPQNVYEGTLTPTAAYNDAGSLYVFSTDLGNAQVAKLYVPDGMASDMLGWAIDVDVFNAGGTRQNGIIVASSIYNDAAAKDAGAVYVWRATNLQSGGDNNGGLGNGTWKLETKLTTFDATTNAYFGNDVAVDVDETTGGTRLVVGAPFEASNGLYSGAVYGYKYQAGVWLPEKFVDAAPQGGSMTNATFFGNAVDVAGTRAVFGSRWRDTGGQTNDGAAYSVELLTQGSYASVMSVDTSSTSSFALTDELSLAAFALDTSSTQGTVVYDDSGRLVYSAGDAFSTLSLGETATDSFTYFTEQGGVTYANLVQVTVYGAATDTQATTATDDVVTVSAAESSLIDVLANDTSANGSLSLLAVQADGLKGSLTIENGKLRYDSQGEFDGLRAGEAVQQSFSYTAVDQDGNAVTGHVTLIVGGVDDVVVAGSDAATVNAGGSVTVNVLANDSDRDGQGTFWVSSLDTSAAKGSFTYNGDGTVTYVPGDAFRNLPLGQTTTDRIIYTVRDSTGHEYSAMLTITVVGTQDGTVGSDGLSHPGNDVAVTNGMSPVVIPVAENDGSGQLVAVNAGSAKGSVVVLDNGTLQYTPGADLAMLTAGTVYVDSFTYTVHYTDGRTETATVSVHVNGEYVVSRLAAEEEDKAFYAAMTSVAMTPLSVTVLPGSDTILATKAAAASDPVADMALDGLIELSAQEQAIEVSVPETSTDALLAALMPHGKPTLSAMLMREKVARHADMAALLRHLA